MTGPYTLAPLADAKLAEVDMLLDRAFGPDRRTRTAYRVRVGTDAIDALSFAAFAADGALAGSIQAWPVALACDDGDRIPMVMVGPVAVAPAIQRAGLGRTLMHHLLDAAEATTMQSHDALMLIGDPEYYERFFGFTADRTARWRLPGPFEPRRLLARGTGLPDRAGAVEPRLAITR